MSCKNISDDDFLNRGIKIIELAKRTYNLYLQQNCKITPVLIICNTTFDNFLT